MRKLYEPIKKCMISALMLISVLGQTIAQKPISTQTCAQSELPEFIDSLKQLILGSKPNRVIALSDSLLSHYDYECDKIVDIRILNAQAYENLYDFEHAIEQYNDLLKTAKKNNLIGQEIEIRIAMARVYETIGRPEICYKYLEEIDELLKAHKDQKQRSHFYVRMASFQRIYRDKNVAREYALKAIESGKASGRIESIADGYLVLGTVTSDLDKSIEYFTKASKYKYQKGDVIGYLFQSLNVATLHIEKQEFEEALAITEALNIDIENLKSNKKSYYQVKSYWTEVRAQIFEALDIQDSLVVALKSINTYSKLFGDFVNQEKINQLVVENAIEQEQEKLDAANRWSRLLLVGLVGLAVITLLLFRYYILVREKNREIAEQKTTIVQQFDELQNLYDYQSTLLSEVHHRIKNNLQLIISLLVLQKHKLGDDPNVGFLDMLNYRIKSISLIHEQLYNFKEFDTVNVAIYAKDLVKNFKALTIERDIEIEFETDDIQLNLETIIPLGLIWSELISNSIKYNTQERSLKIFFSLKKNGNSYHMHYSDNGSGYPEGELSSNGSGIGYTIISSLVRQLSASFNSFNENGAHFTISFQQKNVSPL